MINCLIVDDEQHAIDIILHYIAQTPGLKVVGSTTNPIEALQTVATQKVDLVFLDIHMPQVSGIDFIKAVNGKCKIILTTAYSEFALEGYELDVVDYLLKPIRLPRFLAAVQKVVKQQQGEPTIAEDDDYIFVKTGLKGKLIKITLTDVDYIEGMKNYVAFHCGSNKIIVYAGLKEIEERLPSKQFLRVHKSFIIRVDRIVGLEGNQVFLKNIPAGLMIGENYKSELMERVRGKLL
jgi:two-component system, LytTR family, response regulator